MQWINESLGVTIEINTEDCGLCYDHTCIGSCEALSFNYSDGHAHLRNPETCNGCGDCEERCPFMAITVTLDLKLFD